MQKCRVCHSPNRLVIDEELLSGTSLSLIAEGHNFHVSALHRHRKNHLLAPAADALKRNQETHQTFGLSVLKKLDALEADLKTVKEKAQESGNSAILMGAIRELREIIKLEAQLTHQLATAPVTNMNILIASSPAWSQIKTALTKALKPYPDAMRDVLSSLKAYLPPQDSGQ